MQKFSFRLQSVLEYRGKLVEQQRLALAAAQARAQAEIRALADLRSARVAGQARLADAQAGLVTVDRVHQLLDYLAALDGRLVEQAAAAEQAEGLVTAAQQQLLALSRDQKALEKLRGRQSDAHSRELLRDEQVETSELAAQRHQLRQGEP